MTPQDKTELEYYRLTMPAVIRHNKKLTDYVARLKSRIIELHMEAEEGVIRVEEIKEGSDETD
jgi:hypothetical protein